MRSFLSSGAEYQSVMMTPPKGSADDSGVNASGSSEGCDRKEFTPSVSLPLSIAVVPVLASSPSLDDPQAARSAAQRTTVKTRMNLLFSIDRRAPPHFQPRRLILA